MLVKLLGTKLVGGAFATAKRKPVKTAVAMLMLAGYAAGGWTMLGCWLAAGLVWFRERVKLLAMAGARRAGRWLKRKGREAFDGARQSVAGAD